METRPKFYELSESVKNVVGGRKRETRIYEMEGPIFAFRMWVEILVEDAKAIPQQFVADYVGVSRAAVHKRVKEGRMTVFRFKLVDDIQGFFGKPRTRHRENYSMVPFDECLTWWGELEDKRNEEGRRSSPPELW